MIEIRDLKKAYHVGEVDVHALRGVNLSVERGEFVAVVGPSGSGKSTLFHILGGLDAADLRLDHIDGQRSAENDRRASAPICARKPSASCFRNTICCRR